MDVSGSHYRLARRPQPDVTAAIRPATLRLGGELPVGRLGFGAMRLVGRGWGEPRDREKAKRVLRRTIELGVTFIDTADAYGPETNELLIREALHPYPPELVIATKGGNVHAGPSRWTSNGCPAHLRRACEGSLRRLGLDSLPLYQLHSVDPDVPVEESVGALADLRTEGKIRHIGLCNVDRDTLERAQRVAPVGSVQNKYNLAERTWEPVLEACEAAAMAFIPWFPLARGWLAGGGGRLARVAHARGATPAQIGLAWVLARSPITLPIPGTTSLEHLEDNVGAAEIELSPDDVAALEGYRLLTYEAARFAKAAARSAMPLRSRRRR
jgi:pyridoxine 4-dehydrogenase